MNCCTDYGKCADGPNCAAHQTCPPCNQDCQHSDTCPARVSIPKVRKYTCDQLGVCQGHNPPCENCTTPAPAQSDELPITMQDDFLNFDWVVRWLWTGMAWCGFFAMLALIAFFWGYKS